MPIAAVVVLAVIATLTGTGLYLVNRYASGVQQTGLLGGEVHDLHV